MVLPPQEDRRVEQNIPRVKKEVLVQPDEFHKQKGKTEQEPKKDERKK